MPVAFTGTPLRPSLTLHSYRSFVAVLGAVLAMHWWLLSGASSGLWPGEAGSTGETVAALSTRMIELPQVSPEPSLPDALPVNKEPSPAPSDREPESLPAQASEAPEAQFFGNTTDQPPPARTETETVLPTLPDEPPSPPISQPPPTSERLPRFAFPPPVILNYDVFGQTDGQKNIVSASITWRHDGENYQASLVVSKFLVNLRQWTSKGALTAGGLAPVRFGEKGFRRAEVASHFVRDEGRVIFSANTAPVVLLPGAQDHLSVFMQLASLWAGEPNKLAGGDTLSFQSIGPRQAETWTFVVSPEERITVPGGNMQAIKLTREPTGDYSTKAEIWLAPQLAYMPAHIRLTEPNGNILDMVWTDSQTP